MSENGVNDNYTKACVLLANAYNSGIIEKDNLKALTWCEEACKAGHQESYPLLFDLLWSEGTRDDELLAIVDAYPDNYELVDRKGRMYRAGRGVPKDLDTACELFRLSSENGVKNAYNRLFDVLWKINTEESKKEMLEFAIPMAESGNRDMMGRLGRAYREGMGVEKDIKLAIEWMNKASLKKLSWAHVELFDLIWQNKDIETESILSRLFKIDTTDPELIDRKGRMYRAGRGTKKNLIAAAECFRYSVKMGVKGGNNRLFDVLWKINTPESLSEMINLASPLASKGNRDMMGRLGRAYREGKGVQKSKELALFWLSKAKDEGLEWAKTEYEELVNAL